MPERHRQHSLRRPGRREQNSIVTRTTGQPETWGRVATRYGHAPVGWLRRWATVRTRVERSTPAPGLSRSEQFRPGAVDARRPDAHLKCGRPPRLHRDLRAECQGEVAKGHRR